DSASLGELCGLLSAIGRIPIRQSVAITGSMNQFGEVQPIGGVNEKIEGFFAACQLKGYEGPQAVVIPVQNVRNLMLREDVLEAVRQKKFLIYAVSHVEEAIALLMGMPAGKADKKGRFPEGSVFRQVADRLQQWHDAEKRNEKEKEEREDSEDEEDLIEEKLQKEKERHHPPEEVPLPKHTARSSRSRSR
ncbi:MAG TPA: S16 family serine protease, partial [Moraxellaceae bacterium]|nr:S16 family serine protease [Moraxellaceae bacterium]